MDSKLALKVDALDNVATIFSNDVSDGMTVLVKNEKGDIEQTEVRGNVPYGHKIALCNIEKGGKIMKYGECIGAAGCDIKKGDYVHVHNLEALRGRGDL